MNMIKQQIKTVLWVIKKSPYMSSLYILLRVLTGLVPTIRILTLAKVVDSLLYNSDIRAVAIQLCILMLTLAWDVVSPSFAYFLEQTIQAVSAAEFQKAVLNKLVHVKAEVLEDKVIREKIDRLQKQADESIGLIFYRTIMLMQSLLELISQLIILCRIRIWLGLAFLLVGIPAIWIASKAGKVEYEENKQVTEHRRIYQMLHDILVCRETSLERGLFGYTQKIDQQYQDEYNRARLFQHTVRKKMFIRMKASSVLCAIISFVLIVLLLKVFTQREITVGMFISLACATMNLVSLLLECITDLAKHQAESNAFLEEASEFESMPEQTGADDTPEYHPLQTIEFRHVSFTYPGTERKVLDNINIKMKMGKSYALIGVNGAGKSTLLKLMMRYYDNYTGEILVNGNDIRKIPYSVVKGYFGYVSQDSYHYALTVRDNLCMGQTYDEATLMRVLNKIGLAEKVKAMPLGLDTTLGKFSEHDTDFSGGEWQKLSIARALLRPFSMLLLDEPSSALDPMAERNFMDEILSATTGRNVLLISHRLSQARNVDHIFVLDGGHIFEQGTFKELINRNGLFHKMYEEQKGWYES